MTDADAIAAQHLAEKIIDLTTFPPCTTGIVIGALGIVIAQVLTHGEEEEYVFTHLRKVARAAAFPDVEGTA